MVLKQFLKKFFQNWSKKSLRGHRTKGGTIGKKFFRNVFLLVQNDCFDETIVFELVRKTISHKKFFSKLVPPLVHRTKGGTIGKKFFRNVFLLVQNDCFDETERF